MPEQSLKSKTAKGLFWGGLSNGLQQVLGMVFGIFLARVLSVDDYGLVGMLAIFTAIGNSIIESGFTAALTNKSEFRHEDYNAVFWFNLIAGVVLYVLLFFAAPWIACFFGRPELVALARVLFLVFVIGAFSTAHNAVLFKRMMVKMGIGRWRGRRSVSPPQGWRCVGTSRLGVLRSGSISARRARCSVLARTCC